MGKVKPVWNGNSGTATCNTSTMMSHTSAENDRNADTNTTMDHSLLGNGNDVVDTTTSTTKVPAKTTSRVSNKAGIGRSFHIGSLYNIWKDSFAPEFDGWDDGLLKASANKTFTNCPEKSAIINEVNGDTTFAKYAALSMDPDLELSVLCGLTTAAKGALSYIADVHLPEHTARVVFEVSALKRGCEILDLDGSSRRKVTEHARSLVSTLKKDARAAYVVAGIEYGADAFCVFDVPLGDQDQATVMELLRAWTQRVVHELADHIDIQNSTSEEDLIQDITQPAIDVSIKIHSDIHSGPVAIQPSPTSLDQTVTFLKEFANSVKDAGNLVPKRVFLSPLTKLAGITTDHVSFPPFETELVDRIRSLVEKFRVHVKVFSDPAEVLTRIKVANSSSTTTNDNTAYDFASGDTFMKKDAEKLVELSRRALQFFQRKAGDVLMKFRKGEIPESELAELVSFWEESLVVGPDALSHVFDNIATTASQVQDLLDSAAVTGVQVVSDRELKKLASNVQKESVTCLCINETLMSNNNVVVNRAMMMSSDRSHGTHTHSITSPVPEWHARSNVVGRFRQVFRQFFAYASDNQSPTIAFGICFVRDPRGNPNDPAFVTVFHNGLKNLISLPGPPEGLPQLVPATIHPNGLKLEWEQPALAPQDVSHYVIEARYVDDPEGRVLKLTTTNDNTSFEIEDLIPSTKYTFYVASATIGGLVSGFGPVSEVVETPKENRLAIRTLFKSKQVHDTNGKIDIYCPTKQHAHIGDAPNAFQKFDIGRRNPVGAREKVILVVGATGTGKTTFINSMANVLFDVRTDDDFRFKVVTQADEGEESSSSVTKRVTAYTFHDTVLPYVLTVIDTPGYGDTEGLQADKQTTALIKDMFESGSTSSHGVDQLDAVCLVVKASDSRLTGQLKYNFNAVLSLFGSDIVENIFVVITFSDASEPPVKLALRDAEIPYRAMFKCNNSAFFEGPKTDPDEQGAQAFYWQVGQKSFEKLFSGLETLVNPKSLSLSKQVLERREELTTTVEQLNKYIKRGLSDLELMRQEDQVVEKHKAQIQANTNFTYVVTETRVVQKDLAPGLHTTACLSCNRTCHENCKIPEDSNKQKCYAMQGGQYCVFCPAESNCHWSVHKNLPYLLVEIQEKVTKTDEDLRAKYATATEDHTNAQKLLENLAEQFGQTECQIVDLIKRVNGSLTELRQIAMRPDMLNEVDYIDMLILAEQEDARPGWSTRVQHLAGQKELAIMIRDAKDPNFNPFKKYKKDGWLPYMKNKVRKYFKN